MEAWNAKRLHLLPLRSPIRIGVRTGAEIPINGLTMNPDSLPANCRAMVEAAERYGRF